jgi:Tfp pilus assembly protein PilF
VATYLGGLATVVDRFEEAESYFEQAAELNTRGEMKYAEAYTNKLWVGCSVRAKGRGTPSARQLLEQARETGAARGYAIVERQANAELSKLS